MDKFQLLNELKSSLEKRGYRIIISLNKPKSNPLLDIVSDKNNRVYITICEAGIKPAKYKKIVFCGISPLIQSLTEIDKTFVVIIDLQSLKPRYILAKLGSTNYRRNKMGRLIFDFKRPDYGNFYHTDCFEELSNEIQKEEKNIN